MKYFFLSASALTLLAACSGGSGGGSDRGSFSGDPAFASFAEAQSQGGDYRAEGVVSSAKYRVSSNGTVTITDDVETDDDAVARLSFKSGIISGIAVRDSEADITLSEDNARMLASRGIILAATNNGDAAAIVGDTNVLGYEYQSFGVWQTGLNGTSGRAAAGSFGAETAGNQMPDAGTAIYAGESIGQVVTNGTDNLTTSYITVDTDFSTVDVSSRYTAQIDPVTGAYEGDRSDLDFHATGNIDGSSFEADITTAGMDGDVDGQFYGPGAQEVGGTFSAVTNDSSYLGSFGASR